ncbi:MAG TPA: fibronectin type III domain-containing protein [Solimonas sp.]|nr:fibronectin type III domain-containing protein [Solimonas sp.]
MRGSDDRTVQMSVAPVGLLTGDDGGECTTVVLGYDGNEPTKALVAGIEASDVDYVANINLVFDDDSIFDDPGPAPADEYPIAGTLPELPIDDLVATASGLRITATWTPPAGTLASVAEYRIAGALSWTSVPPVIGGTAAFVVSASGSYQVRVRAYGAGGAVGQLSDPVVVAVS